uniref:Arm_2 domain-containing protein n=1 Tax=Steinernema glaseri TaxID=37863 RepID=A0A1I7ZXR1_9BILA
MGQQQSAFVVEIASPRFGKFQSIPQKDPDEDNAQWRITVNPAADINANEDLRGLINRLHNLSKLIQPPDAKQILTALQYLDTTQDLLLPLLTVISNATAFPGNQIILREYGITRRIVDLLMEKNASWPKSCRVMLIQCVANMAGDMENEKILSRCVPTIVRRLDSPVELESVVALQALTNLSVNISPRQLEAFMPAIPICLQKLWVHGETNLHSLRLLVNLSCCPDMVPYILAAKTVTGLLSILDTDKNDVLLRAVTWILCASCAVEALGISYEQIAPLNQDPFGNPNYTVYHTLYGMKGKSNLEKRINELTNYPDPEISSKSKRLLDILRAITPFRPSVSSLNRL